RRPTRMSRFKMCVEGAPFRRHLFQCFPTCLFDMPRLLDWLELLSPRRLFWSDAHRSDCERVRRAKEAVMRVLVWPTAAALLIAVGLPPFPATTAQVHPPSPGPAAQSPNISAQKLNGVATAIERVASLKQDYQQRIAAAAPSDKERIANEAI